MDSITEVDQQILKHEQEIARLKEARKKLAVSPEMEALVDRIHDFFCSGTGYSNHTDGCGWFYEFGDAYPGGKWNGYAHKRYLKVAEWLTARGYKPDELINILDDLQEARKGT